MGALALLVPSEDKEFGIDPGAAARLAELGVNRVSLLRDERVVAIVLEGWAFDAERCEADAVDALLGDGREARVLHDLAQLSISRPASG